MKRSSLIVGLIVLIVLGVGLAWLLMTHATSTPATTTNSSSSSSTTSTGGNATDMTSSGSVTVTMKDEAFSPQSIKIKKGTKVTWVNNDSIEHNVVANDANNPDNLPTSNSLFGKGGTYSFTFNTAGTIDYFCTIHPFMTGTVEVVD